MRGVEQLHFSMALLGIIGALLAGGISDRLGRRRPMSATFALRGAAYVGLLGLGLWPTPLVLSAAITCMGLSWSSTIPLVSTTCTDLYGRRSAFPARHSKSVFNNHGAYRVRRTI
jgi:MFS family permease